MKTIAFFLVLILTAAAMFASGPTTDTEQGIVAPNSSGCDGPKQEETSNGVQVRLEICGSDQDGYDIDAANPDSGEKRECRASFTLAGKDKKDEDKSAEISREKRFTVSSTAKGWFNAEGESGLPVKGLKIRSFSVSCS